MQNKRLQIENIDSKLELRKLKVTTRRSGSGAEVKLPCPFHNDTNPSLALNTETNVFLCAGCDQRGTIIELLSKFKNQSSAVTTSEMHSLYNIYDVDSVSIELVDKYAKNLRRPKNPKVEKLRKELHARGVTDALISTGRLGVNEDNGRISIPIFDAAGNCINLRFYLPGAPKGNKFINIEGRGANAIYRGADVEKFNTIWLLGGEMKALAASRWLSRMKRGCISASSGEGNWDNSWNSRFQGKKVYICFDIDRVGRTKAITLARTLFKFAKEVYVVSLPLNKATHPKGDMNDFIMEKGNSMGPKVFEELEAKAQRIENKTSIEAPSNEPAIQVSLNQAVNPKYVGKKLTFRGIPIAKQEQPYLTPKEVKVTCGRDQKGCNSCAIKSREFDGEGSCKVVIPVGSRATLAFVGSNDIALTATLKNTLGIPRCTSFSLEITEQYSVWDSRIQPVVDVKSNSSHTVQETFILGKSPQLNDPHEFNGTLWSDPKSQKAILLIQDSKRVDGDLESFTLTDREYQALEIFRPKEDTLEEISHKLRDIYEDLSINITGIVGRTDLHLAVDLTYHCPILYELDGKMTGGWMNTLVVGDSSQGKSEVSKRLQEHYALGEWVECKNATAPGLIGGLQQMAGTWFVTWGGIPRNDKKLMILEEAKGLNYETIRKLTELRSSGVASLDKIEQRRILARTRLLWLSNPRGDEKMAEFPTGIEVVTPLIGAPEDVRRFDIILIVDEREINTDEIHRRLKKKVKHVFVDELCRKLALLSWTRTPEQIKISEQTSEEIKQVALNLSKKFASRLPILEPGSARLKISRIACAIAARLFSYEGENLIVKPVHAQWAGRYLNRIYCNKYSGFDTYCIRNKEMTELLEPAPIVSHVRGAPYPLDLIKGLLFTDQIQTTNFEDWLGVGQEEAKAFLGLFVRKRALMRTNKNSARSYKKTPGFINLLKELEIRIEREGARKTKVTETISKEDMELL